MKVKLFLSPYENVYCESLRLCLVWLIWESLLFKKMDLRRWRLFG